MGKYTKNQYLYDLRTKEYNNAIWKRIGKSSDTKEYYSEIASRYIIENVNLFDKKMVSRKSSYNMQHQGCSDNDELKSVGVGEKIRVKCLFSYHRKNDVNLPHPVLGWFIDYETPIADSRNDGKGAIDALTVNDDLTMLRLVEFKKPASKEPLLRCILEIHHYYQIIDWIKLKQDFNLPLNISVKKTIVLDPKSRAFDDYHNNEMHYVKKLVDLLEVSILQLEPDELSERISLIRNK